MKLLHTPASQAPSSRRGAALMLALLVLFILILIVSQIHINTLTEQAVTRNSNGLTALDEGIQGSFLEVSQWLIEDAEAAASGGEAGGLGGLGGPGGGLGGDGSGGDAGQQESEPTDSRQDDWFGAKRTEFNGGQVQLRIFIQDEDSKYNVLSMLTEDEDEAEKAFERVVRVLDLCREGTLADIDGGDARNMAEDMRDYMTQRTSSDLMPRPDLLTNDEDEEDLVLPLSLREFVVLPSFDPSHFRDFRDRDGTIVHSIGSFLTVTSALTTLSLIHI